MQENKQSIEQLLYQLATEFGESFDRRVIEKDQVRVSIPVTGSGAIYYYEAGSTAIISFFADTLPHWFKKTYDEVWERAYQEAARHESLPPEQINSLRELINSWDNSVKSRLDPKDIARCPPGTLQALRLFYLGCKAYGRFVQEVYREIGDQYIRGPSPRTIRP